MSNCVYCHKPLVGLEVLNVAGNCDACVGMTGVGACGDGLAGPTETAAMKAAVETVAQKYVLCVGAFSVHTAGKNGTRLAAHFGTYAEASDFAGLYAVTNNRTTIVRKNPVAQIGQPIA